MLVLKLAEETLSADEAIVEDAPRGAQEFRGQRIAQLRGLTPSLRPATMLSARKTASGCDTTGRSTPSASWSSCTCLSAVSSSRASGFG